MIRTIKTKYKKETQNRYWTTNQRRNNYRNRMEYKRKKTQKDLLWTMVPEATHPKTISEHRTERDKLKTIKKSNYITDTNCQKETHITHQETFSGQNK